ncbi:MAG: hypothetical protein KC484_06145 [Colwelliaceae bacterium]|nr:hypothetical protein [Colwelliaceae bacterium]
MPFLHSLFCWNGCDNRYRFSIIIALSHLFFIIFTTIFSSTFIICLFILLISTIVITGTTKRRLKDALLTKTWLYTPSISFALIGLITISFDHQALYWLILIPVALSSILLTYISKNNLNYIYGYYGPIDLKFESYPSSSSQRIEPTLKSANSSVDSIDLSSPQRASYTHSEMNLDSSTEDIGELIRNKFLNQNNGKFIIMGVAIIITIAMLTSFILSFINSPETITTQQDRKAEEEVVLRENMLQLPDDFSLMTTAYNGLIINWQADDSNQKTLWNIRKVSGDANCKTILFNNNENYRTTLVTVEKTNDYFAEFSPLDTKEILKSIAIRSSFTLCGYSFSLKGSQSTLDKHIYYSTLITD